jgi:hypothetical protein
MQGKPWCLLNSFTQVMNVQEMAFRGDGFETRKHLMKQICNIKNLTRILQNTIQRAVLYPTALAYTHVWARRD